MTASPDGLPGPARRLAAFVARLAADPSAAAALRGDLRAYAKKARKADLVFAPGDDATLRVNGNAVSTDDEDVAKACVLLASRLAAYGVEELTITTSAAEADLFDLIRLLAAEPTGADAAVQFAARAAAVDSRSIPRKLKARPESEAPSAPVPTAAPVQRTSKPVQRVSGSTAAIKEEPSAKPPTPAPEVAPKEAVEPVEDVRSDQLAEAVDVPKSSDPALAKLFDELQKAEKPEELTPLLDALASHADLAFRTGRFEQLLETMTGLVAIEYAQLPRRP